MLQQNNQQEGNNTYKHGQKAEWKEIRYTSRYYIQIYELNTILSQRWWSSWFDTTPWSTLFFVRDELWVLVAYVNNDVIIVMMRESIFHEKVRGKGSDVSV